jgi:hypothetical protein
MLGSRVSALLSMGGLACAILSAQGSSSLSSVSVSPLSVVGGTTVTGRVVLTEFATGPVTIALSASLLPTETGPVPVTVPWAVVVRPGQDHVDFSITTAAVSPSVKVRITATDRLATKLVDLIIFESSDPTVREIKLDNTVVTGGDPVSGVATLTRTPSFGTNILLKSSNSSAACILDLLGQCNGQLFVSTGTEAAIFQVKTFPVSTSTIVTISGVGPGAPSMTLTVNPGNSLKDLFLVDRQLLGGRKTGGIISMDGPAPKSGTVSPQPQSSRPDLVAVQACRTLIPEGLQL